MKSVQEVSKTNVKAHHRVSKRYFLMDGLRVGLTVGILSALWHVAWLVLVATNTAQMVTDAALRLHSIEPVYLVHPFRLEFALSLIALSTVGGFVLGYLYSMIWNSLGPVVKKHRLGRTPAHSRK
jgi:hypothetical protein